MNLCSTTVYGQCPFCGGSLVVGHVCPVNKSCSTCKWYKKQLCMFNPIVVEKKPDDMCSHWTARMMNEAI